MKINPIVITFLAGLSTTLGYFSIYIKGNKDKIISKILSFTGGVMITLSIIDLIPTSLRYLDKINIINLLNILIFFSFGFLIFIYMNKNIKQEALYKTGLISMIGIIMHNIPEGILTFTISTINIRLGLILSISIMLHNIPEGISISLPIYYSTKSKIKAFIYTFISGMSELLGAFLSLIFLNKFMSNIILSILFSFISGLMISIGYFELIKLSKKYDKNNTYLYSLVGSLFIIFVEILLKFST